MSRQPEVPSLPIRVGVSAAITRGGQLLLVGFDDESGFHFNLPGGGVEAGESLHEAVHREVWEECGAEVSVGPLLLCWEYVPVRADYLFGRQPSVRFLFRCTLRPDSEPRLPERPDPHQVSVQWVPLAALPEAPLIPAIAERLVAALAAPAAVDPFYPLFPSAL